MIRRAEKTDRHSVVNLIRALANFEELPPPDAAAEARFASDAWPEDGSKPRCTVWLAEHEVDGKTLAVGYAITFDAYSSFLAKPTLYLEDIFVLDEYRRTAFGTLIMEHLIEYARATGCGRVEWVVLDWNTSAQQFYERLGAANLKEWLHYRITL